MSHELFGVGIDTLLFLIAGSTFAGFVDAICGGGGLISVPVLLTAGFSPAQAIAANKPQGAVGALASTHYYAGKKILDRSKLLVLLPPAMIGGALGTLVNIMLGNDFMSKILPILLILMALYFAFSKKVSDDEQPPKLAIGLFAATIVPLIAFYDGFFGPGAGTFYLLAVTSMLGMTVINGMAYSRVLNLASNLISLLLFICLGKMVWTAGIAMSIGETIGVYAGSHFVYRNGAKLVKPLVVVACLLMALRSLDEAYFS